MSDPFSPLPPWPVTAAGVLATTIGVGAVVAPAVLTRAFGLPPADGSSALAWRLFGVRTAAIGLGIAGGSAHARAVLLPVQAVDQAVMLAAGLTGTVPRRAAAMGVATSWVLVLLGLAGRRR